MGEPEFHVEEVAVGAGGSRVRVEGSLTYAVSGRLRRALEGTIRVPSSTQVDLSGVTALDGGAAAILAEVWSEALRGGAAISFTGARGHVKSVLDLYTERMARECLRPPPGSERILEQLGRESLRLVGLVKQALGFLGRFGEAVVEAGRRVRSVNWADVPRLMERHGVDGVPIALTIAFLIGLITAFQAALQLRQYGADALVSKMVSISITRELGPLMTAIIVAGRSGAAIAAEMGTMKVTEEIDALRTLGLSPDRFLIFPRLVALVLVLPVLTLMADLVGILGGFCIAVTQLDVTAVGFMVSVRDSLEVRDVMGGVLKSVVFGAIIALTACERGLATKGGAEGVGRSTTGAVVTSLFHLILADALFSVLFDLFGI